MLYAPMTNEQAEDAWVAAFEAYITTRDNAEASALSAYMAHLKREYHIIPAVTA